MNKRSVGSFTETMAAQFLEAQGLHIVDRNFHAGRLGEIDLIARDGRTMIFIEVKYRSSLRTGYPEEAVTPQKQWTICRIAQHYLNMKKAPADTPVRFDVVAIRRVLPEEQMSLQQEMDHECLHQECLHQECLHHGCLQQKTNVQASHQKETGQMAPFHVRWIRNAFPYQGY